MLHGHNVTHPFCKTLTYIWIWSNWHTPLLEALMLNWPNVTYPFCKTLTYIRIWSNWYTPLVEVNMLYLLIDQMSPSTFLSTNVYLDLKMRKWETRRLLRIKHGLFNKFFVQHCYFPNIYLHSFLCFNSVNIHQYY